MNRPPEASRAALMKHTPLQLTARDLYSAVLEVQDMQYIYDIRDLKKFTSSHASIRTRI